MSFYTRDQQRRRERSRAYKANISANANNHEVLQLSASSASSPSEILGSTQRDNTGSTIFQRFCPRSARALARINNLGTEGRALLEHLFANGSDHGFGSDYFSLEFDRREDEDTGDISWAWSEATEKMGSKVDGFQVWVKQLVHEAVATHHRVSSICLEFKQRLE
ncbi:hypothetical protein BCV69DRAFT_279396 [Microstroma glucosiphilum]|uniref:Uncharacterized protein n=1 Tax=Pseudomicrostroma glucosiphilum TaxID=1684307 RepID=A0A316TWH0_9BASI|nr:hypothetical protein BCV69DRAFT_279396 [Pseudomicrostroma glucosiphilum]PWN17677.1 hypothetical protein BCV69DRAFT_279396 [Pseudomicrostroma glucosiphilum]